MNENIDLTKILKDCPRCTKLYSTILGDVCLNEVNRAKRYPVIVTSVGSTDRHSFTSDGKFFYDYNGECILFPSKDQRDWSKFTFNKPKFDPKTLKPFDKVLVQCTKSENWRVQLFSHIIEGEGLYPYVCIGYNYEYCIPYNNDTKHLVGTNEEAPEYYRYWED